MCLSVDVFVFILLEFSEIPEFSLVCVINFGTFLAITTSDISLVLSFLSLWYSNYVYVVPFEIVPQFLDGLVFFILFFSLHFSVGSSVDISVSPL